jgi:hypothetical protein
MKTILYLTKHHAINKYSILKYHAMKTRGGVEIQLHEFLISALDGGEWSASHPGRFTPGERAPGTHWIGG